MTQLKPQILSVTMAGWPGMRGEVRLDLGWRRTVLVGRNGVGKSVVMESFVESARLAWARRARDVEDDVRFSCEIGTPGHVQLRYRFEVSPTSARAEDGSIPGAPPERRLEWRESCHSGNGDLIWSVERNEAKFGDGRTIAFPRGVGVLGMFHAIDEMPKEAQQLRSRLGSVSLVRAGVPRVQQSHKRDPIYLKLVDEHRWQAIGAGRTERLAVRIAYLWETSPEEDFVELSSLVGRLGLGQSLQVAAIKANDTNTLGWVQLDGVNIGQLSDGTLRVIELLVNVLSAKRGVICIEEPETGIHPGLLERVLAIFETYSHDRQLVLATHSPYVLRWCDPADLRLVELLPDATSVRSLGADEVDRVEAYLRDEGTLDSFIFEHSDEE